MTALPLGWRFGPDGWRAGAGLLGVVALLAAVLLGVAGRWPVAGSLPSSGPVTALRGQAAPGHRLDSLPLAAQGVVSATLGRDGPGYRVAGRHVRNPAENLTATFSRAGATMVSGAGRVRLSLVAVGRSGALSTVSATSPRVAQNRVSYAHRDFLESWVNGPLGLEQVVDIRSRPAAGAGPLTLAVGVKGDLSSRLDQGGVVLSGLGVSLRYGGLWVTDARGRVLRSWLALAPGRIVIGVDDRGATYPLRVDPFVQQTKLVVYTGNSNGDSNVALSSDGNIALVGGPSENNGYGAAWVFVRSGSTWSEQGSELTANDETSNNAMGSAVALSGDGNTALLGGGEGAWVFSRSGSTWTQQGPKLAPNDEAYPKLGAAFGDSVALSADGNTALIGGPRDNATNGAAWVFTRSGSTWTQQGAKLTANDEGPGGGSDFGWSVSLSADGNTALIGGWDDSNGPWNDNSGSGAAWVFSRSGSTWTQQGPKLTPNDAAQYQQVGWSVAVSGDGKTALLGDDSADADSASWVFTRSGSTWTQEGSKLTPSGGAGSGKVFGSSVALSYTGNTALIGEYGSGTPGSAWIFTRSGQTWTQQQKIDPSGQSGNGNFGAGVAVACSTALISGTSAAWVFTNPDAASGTTSNRASADARTSSATGSVSSPCGLNIDAQAFDGSTSDQAQWDRKSYVLKGGSQNYYPVAGLHWEPGFERFLSRNYDQFLSIDGTTEHLTALTCWSGCSDIVVHVTQPEGEPTGQPVRNARVTASVPDVLSSLPTDTLPVGDGNYICPIDDQGARDGSCGTTAKATTDFDGNALFRYFMPGVVTPDWPQPPGFTHSYQYPKAVFTFSVTNGFCGCITQAPLNTPDKALQFFPRLWLNKNAVITGADVNGLEAILSQNAINQKTAKTQATDIITTLSDSKVISGVVIKSLKGLADLALSDEVLELMRKTPDLVKLDWFMSEFRIADTGLLDYNADLSAFGQRIKGPLLRMLSGKFNQVAGIAFNKLSAKLKPLKTRLDQIEKKLDGWFASEAQQLYNQKVGYPFSHYANKLVNEILYRGTTKPYGVGHATLKLFDISTCDGQCDGEPLPAPFGGGHYKLFMLFSETNHRHAPYFFPPSYSDETPISFNPNYWIPWQCSAVFGCGPEVR